MCSELHLMELFSVAILISAPSSMGRARAGQWHRQVLLQPSHLHMCPAWATDMYLCRSHTAMCVSLFPSFNSFPLKFLMLWWHLWLSKWLFLFSRRIFLLKCSHTTICTLILCCNYVIKQQSSSGHGTHF